jgi:hypothetical protein
LVQEGIWVSTALVRTSTNDCTDFRQVLELQNLWKLGIPGLNDHLPRPALQISASAILPSLMSENEELWQGMKLNGITFTTNFITFHQLVQKVKMVQTHNMVNMHSQERKAGRKLYANIFLLSYLKVFYSL